MAYLVAGSVIVLLVAVVMWWAYQLNQIEWHYDMRGGNDE